MMNIRPAVAEHITRYGEIYAEAFSGEPWNDPMLYYQRRFHSSGAI